MTSKKGNAVSRSTYRHGDLRQALLQAGIAQARAGGPEAIVLREATRQVGVVPNAAYRHFTSRQELLLAVRAYALSSIARAMEAEIRKLDDGADPAALACGSLQAVGIAYLSFARREPGLFRTAFSVPFDPADEPQPAEAGESGLNPFQLLGAALDRMVECGALPPERRPGAEYLAWSAVHGLAVLASDGPLQGLSEAQRMLVAQRLVSMVEKGL